MVAKINVGNSLYGALAYNGEKVNEGQGRLLLTHKIFDDGTGTFDIRRAAEDFTRYLPEQVRTSKPVVHISLNPHPDDRLTDTELTAIAEEYLAHRPPPLTHRNALRGRAGKENRRQLHSPPE